MATPSSGATSTQCFNSAAILSRFLHLCRRCLELIFERGVVQERDTVALLDHAPVFDDPIDCRGCPLLVFCLHLTNQVDVVGRLDRAALDDGGSKIAALRG